MRLYPSDFLLLGGFAKYDDFGLGFERGGEHREGLLELGEALALYGIAPNRPKPNNIIGMSSKEQLG